MKKSRFGKVIALLLVAALFFGGFGITGHYQVFAAEEPSAAVEQTTDESVDQADANVVLKDSATQDTAVSEDATVTAESTQSVDTSADQSTADEASDADVEESVEASDDADAEEAEEISMPAQDFEKELKAEKLTVTVKAEEGALPAETEMDVKAVTDKETLDKISDKAEKEASDDVAIGDVQAVDISFWYEGEKIEPEENVYVTIASSVIEDTDEQMIIRVNDEESDKVADNKKGKAEVVKEMTERQLKKKDITPADDEIVFETELNSVYAVVGMESISTEYLTADGETYNITITYGPEAEIPADAKLQVNEILAGTDQYDSYNEQAQELVGNDNDSEAEKARFFDIEIISKGRKIEPSAPVEVKIEYADAVELAEGEVLQVVHFADDGAEVITPEVNGNEITFSQESFSVTGTIVAGLGSSQNVVLIAEHNGKYYEVLYNGSLKEIDYDGTSLNTDDTIQIDMAERWARSGNNPNYRLRVQNSGGYTYISPTATSGLSGTQTNLTYTNNLLSTTSGGTTSYLGVNETATAITGGNSQANAARFYLATVPTPSGNTVDHIDIGVVATAKVNVPLAYGPYYDADGNLLFTVSKDNPINGYGFNNNIPITQNDLMASTVSSYTLNAAGEHVPLNNFVITSFTTSTGSGQAIDQVRYNGTFPVGTSASSANKVYYNVDVTKPVDLSIVYDYDGDGDDDILYDMDGNPLVVNVVTSLDASFDYWDSRNECPGILNSTQVNRWRNGEFVTGNGGGMDFRLGASSESDATLTAIEIVKYVVDEDGNTIELQEDSQYVVDFKIYQNADGDVTAPTAWSGETTESVDYSGYSTNDTRNVTVGTSGIGLAYDYDVTDGLTYIEEIEEDIPETITDKDGNIREYMGTYIETEYAWRNDDGTTHSNINQSDTLSAIPDVVGDYYSTTWDEDGDGTPDSLHNTFLEFYVYNVYSTNKTEVTVEKVWDDAQNQDGIRPSNVEVVLNGSDGSSYKATLDGTADSVPTGSAATGYESAAWKATFINLPVKTSAGEDIAYTASETTTSVITGTDGPGTYAFAVTGSQENGFTVTNTHTPELTEATVKKVWDDADNQDGIRPETLTVTLSNGDSVTLSEDNGWTATKTGLPKYANGTEIKYTWTEGTLPKGYSLTNTKVEGTITTFTNSHTPEVTEATVKKVWDDANNQDGKRPETLTVTLSNGDTVTLSEDNEWTATITGLPKYENEGEEITYTWTEDEEGLPEGYELTDTSVDGTITTLTNSYEPEVTEATVKKVWDDANNQDGKRPTTLKVTLSNGDTATLNADNEWTATITGLPKYKNEGEEITYTWTEDEEGLPEGYELTDTSVDGTITTLTNSYTPELTEATVKKVWDGANNQDGKRPTELKVTLSNGTEVTLNKANEWTATVDNLPKYENEGTEIAYTWTEDEEGLPEGYKLTDTSVDGTITTLTNSYEPEETTATIVKVWDDAENQDGKRPNALQVTLLANETEVKTITLNKANEWTAKVENLPVYENEGQEITYTWTEDEEGLPEGYELTDTSVNGTITTLTNSYTPEETEATVKKVWDDADDQDGKRPTTLTVTLSNGDMATLSESNEWTATITGLPKYENEGQEIKYTWDETSVPEGYELISNETVGTITTLTNKHEPELIDIPVEKVWEDSDNKYKIRPESITVQLLADDVEVAGKTLTLSEDNEWKDSFVELPKYAAKKEIKYGVKEDIAVTGYKTVITGDAATGFVITNTLELGDLVVKKAVDRFETNTDATFIFQVVANVGDIEVYNDTVTLTLDTAGEKSATIADKIPVGATVTVEEIYGGADYEIVGSLTADTTILSKEDEAAPATVSFTNTYDNKLVHGYGILNNYSNDGEWTHNASKTDSAD